MSKECAFIAFAMAAAIASASVIFSDGLTLAWARELSDFDFPSENRLSRFSVSLGIILSSLKLLSFSSEPCDFKISSNEARSAETSTESSELSDEVSNDTSVCSVSSICSDSSLLPSSLPSPDCSFKASSHADKSFSSEIGESSVLSPVCSFKASSHADKSSELLSTSTVDCSAFCCSDNA